MLTLILLERQRDREGRVELYLPSIDSHSPALLGQAEDKSWERNLGLPSGWQKPKYLCEHLVLFQGMQCRKVESGAESRQTGVTPLLDADVLRCAQNLLLGQASLQLSCVYAQGLQKSPQCL